MLLSGLYLSALLGFATEYLSKPHFSFYVTVHLHFSTNHRNALRNRREWYRFRLILLWHLKTGFFSSSHFSARGWLCICIAVPRLRDFGILDGGQPPYFCPYVHRIMLVGQCQVVSFVPNELCVSCNSWSYTFLLCVGLSTSWRKSPLLRAKERSMKQRNQKRLFEQDER